MDKEQISEIINDLYLFYRVFVSSHFSENQSAPHIKKLSRELMKMYEGSDENYKRLCVAMPPRHKLSHNTDVLTTDGWKKHGDLKIGDYVFGLDGKPTKIIGVSDESICDRLITFSNGSQILSHEDHLWSVYRRGNSKLQVIPTKDMENNFSYVEKNGKKRYRFHLPLIDFLKFDEKELPIDPYWFGYWLGDGSSTKPCIIHAKEDSQFIDNVDYKVSKQHIHKDTGVYTTYFSNQGLLEKLRKLNVYDNKHIPKIYKTSSFEQRCELLAGLIDSDGSVDKNGRVRFINTNKQLIDDVLELCNGLGLYPYLMHYPYEKINEYKNNNNSLPIVSKKDSYHIGFQPRFTIPTKVPRKKIVEKGLRRKLAITNIEKVNNGELGKCIEIENDDGIYLVGKELIPTHNSKSSLITLAFPMWLIFHNPNLNILIITNSGGLSEKFGISLREYISEYGKYFNVYLSDVKKSSSYLMFCDESKRLYNGSIRLVGKGGSITGTDADILILDDIYKGLEEEFTPSALQKTNENFYNQLIEQRLEPHSLLIILHTRWRSNDLQGYLKQNDPDSYKFIEFPAILDDGTPLWKERYTIDVLEKKRERMGVRMFNAIYQQKPMDEDSDFFDLTKLKSGKPQNVQMIGKCRAWDIAGSTDEQGDLNDYTVGILMELYEDNSVCITDIVRGQFGTYVKEIIKETAMHDGLDTHIVIETGVAGAGKLLYADWKEHLRGFIVEQALPVTSKEDRATPFKNAMLDGLVYIDVGDDLKKDFKLELSGFPFTLHDDQVDSASHGFNYLCRMDKGISPDIQFIDLF